MKEQKLQSGGNPDLVGLLRLAGSAKRLKKIAKEVEYFSMRPVSLPFWSPWVGIDCLSGGRFAYRWRDVRCPRENIGDEGIDPRFSSLDMHRGRAMFNGILRQRASLATPDTSQALLGRPVGRVQLQCPLVVDCGIWAIPDSLERFRKP